MKTTLLTSILLTLLATGCSYTTKMGTNDEWTVTSSTQLFAPSATIVERATDHYTQVIGGQSIVSQIQGAAAATIGGYFIGQGLSNRQGTVINDSSTNANGGSLIYGR